MMFSPARLLPKSKVVIGAGAAAIVTTAGMVFPTAPAHGEPPPPPAAPLHDVKYTVFAEQPFYADIYYRDVDPPNFADYSHNPYLYSPKAQAEVGPDKQWVLDVKLANPDLWAMVTVTSAPSTQSPNLHCVLAVDGVVVATDAGPKGAVCSIRTW